MKKIIYSSIVFILLLLLSIDGFSQNVGIGTPKPDQSAVLDVQSENKGFLMPRMSLQQRNTIQNPAKGLIVYQTDMLSGFYFYDGASWKPISSSNTSANAVADGYNWGLTGNAAIASNFLGTTNNIPLVIRVNNVKSGEISTSQLFLGYQAGLNGGTGKQNLGIGVGALKAATDLAGTTYKGSYNTAVGVNALSANTSGYQNVGLGYASLSSNTSGYDNFGLGYGSLRLLTTGNSNVAIGSSALANLVTGNSNIAIGGYSAFQKLGNNNVYIGANSGRATTTQTDNNSVMIGNSAGYNKYGSSNVYIGYQAGYSATLKSENTQLFIANSSTALPLIGGDFSKGFVKINVKPQVNATGGTTSPSSTLGFLAIGDFSDANFASATKVPVAGNGYRLYVQDGVMTEKVKVALKSTADWADYVFEPTYERMSLEKVEAYVKENKHLPNVPSAEEMAKEGLDVSKTSAKLMEKIEELTLYMIELNKELKALKAENEALKQSLKK